MPKDLSPDCWVQSFLRPYAPLQRRPTLFGSLFPYLIDSSLILPMFLREEKESEEDPAPFIKYLFRVIIVVYKNLESTYRSVSAALGNMRPFFDSLRLSAY